MALLCSVIRQFGVSDSAAAARFGMSTSTLSRWKQEHPELKAYLAQAREECRAQQLDLILQSAQSDPVRGWRAAAWLLERLYPADYHPRAAEREKFQHLRERQQEAERREERARRAAQRENAASASEGDSHNSRNPPSATGSEAVVEPPSGEAEADRTSAFEGSAGLHLPGEDKGREVPPAEPEAPAPCAVRARATDAEKTDAAPEGATVPMNGHHPSGEAAAPAQGAEPAESADEARRREIGGRLWRREQLARHARAQGNRR